MTNVNKWIIFLLGVIVAACLCFGKTPAKWLEDESPKQAEADKIITIVPTQRGQMIAVEGDPSKIKGMTVLEQPVSTKQDENN